MKKKELQRIDMFLFLGNRYRETKKRSVNWLLIEFGSVFSLERKKKKL